MPTTKAKQQTYSLRGKVTQVYEPREVNMQFGNKKVTKEVSDLYLQLENGSKVKVSFWDTDISHHDGASLTISNLIYKGKYNNVAQWSATKDTNISVTGKGKKAAPTAAVPEEEVPEGAINEEEPTFSDGEPEAEEVPEGAETEETTEEPVPAVKPVATKKRATKTTSTVPGVYKIHPDASAEITALAAEAVRIAGYTAAPVVKEDANAFARFTNTLFIALSTKNFYANGGRQSQ